MLAEFCWGDNGAYGNRRGDQSGYEAYVHGFYEYPESVKRNLLPLVRRLPRCKTAHLEDIGNVWRSRNRDGSNVINIMVKGNRHEVYLGKEKSA